MGRYPSMLGAAAGTLAWAATPMAAEAQQRAFEYGPGWHGGWHMGWGGMILGPLMMILFVAAVVFLVVVALRWLGVGHASGAARESGERGALDILEARYARGEIDKDEFEERRRILRG